MFVNADNSTKASKSYDAKEIIPNYERISPELIEEKN